MRLLAIYTVILNLKFLTDVKLAINGEEQNWITPLDCIKSFLTWITDKYLKVP